MKKVFAGVWLLLSLVALAGSSRANEFTDVIDAFDDSNHDPFDIKLDVGYERLYRHSEIRREAFEGATPHPWDYYSYHAMFESTQVQHLMNFGLTMGLYKDLEFQFRLPLILSDTRKLTGVSQDGWTDVDGNGTVDTVFATPFRSPDRSGIDYIAFALRWGILDQGREEAHPNWTFSAEGRFGVGTPLEASCIDETTCGGPNDSSNPKSPSAPGLKGGVSRGLNEVVLGTRLSRRYGLLDPYFGFEAIIGWPKGGTAYSKGGGNGINTIPPVIGAFDFGLELIPWEVIQAERKLVIGLGARSEFHSEGREYTALFDALGTSPYFKGQEFVDSNGDNSSTGEINRGEVEAAESAYTGLTDVENYAVFKGTLWVLVQPAKYVKFRLGFDVGHETEHFLTKTDQCRSDNIQEDGLCAKPNFSYRPEIDSPGSRLRAESTLLWAFFFDATAMF